MMNFQSFNEPSLMGQFSGDEEILLDMIDIFQKSIDSLLGPIRESIEEQNGTQLRINAHTFKGVMRNFYADGCEQMASSLEAFGERAEFGDALKTLNKLEDHLMLFVYELHIFKKELSAS